MLRNFILLLFCIQKCLLFEVSVISSNSQAGGTANHVFLFEGVNQTIYANSYIQIQYDPLWILTSSTEYDSAKDFCETGCTIGLVTCTNTSNNIKINKIFPVLIVNTSYTAQFTIKNVVNPSKIYSQTFNANLFMSDGTLYNSASTDLSVSAAIMGCTGVPSNKLISTINEYVFTITPAIAITASGYMIANFPIQWSDSAETNVFQSPNCTNAINSISCVATSSSTIKLTSLVLGSTSAQFTFNISGIRNPGTTGVNQELFLSYYSVADQLISMCNVQISGLTPTSLTGVSFSLSCNTTQVTIGFLYFTIIQKPLITDKMVLTLSSDIQIIYLTKAFIYAGNDTTPLNKQITVQSKSLVSSQIQFYPFKNSVINYFRVQLYNLKCPSTTKQTTNMQIDILRMGNIITTYQCCKTSSNLPTFQSASLSIDDNRMAYTANYQFNLTLNQTIGIGTTYIDFIFPSMFGLVVNDVYSCFIVGYTDPAKTLCKVISTTLLSLSLISDNISLILSTLKSVNVLTNLQLSIIIKGLKNPSAAQVSFDIYMADSLHSYLQGTTGVISSLTAALISGVQITPLSSQVFLSTTYTFKINNTNPLITNSILRIRFPSQLKLNSPICKINGANATFSQTIVGSQDQVVIILPNSAIAQYGLFAYTVTIDNVINSQSFQLTDSFVIQLESNLLVLEGVYQSLTVQMTQTGAFATLSVSLLNNTVYELTEYSISYSLPMAYNLSRSYRLKIAFPSEYRIYTCYACSNFSQFTLTSSSGILKFDQIMNPYKTAISSSIICQLYIDNFLSLQSSYVVSTFNSIVQDFNVKFSNNVMGKAVTYWVTGLTMKAQMKEVRIQLPSQVSIGTLNVTCLQCEVASFTQSSKLIKVLINKMEFQNVTFQITGIVNPLTYPSSIFTVSTYSSDTVLISQSTTILNFFTIVCAPACQTCDSLNTSLCLTCYQNTVINSLKYMDFTGQNCIAGCTSSQYLINSTCYPCDTLCASCTGESHNCTSCSGLRFLLGNLCVLTCPDTYYPQSNNCQPCVPPCLVCTSSSLCTYCVYGKLLQSNGSCQASCSVGQYNKSNICTACPQNCSACDSSGCLACSNSNFLINGNCIPTCPFGSFTDATNLLCQACKAPCKYCYGNSSNCTGCDTSSLQPYFYLNQCLPSCLPTYFGDVSFNCQPCLSPCLNCNSQVNCSSCLPGYLFYSFTNQCLIQCLNNTIKIGFQCYPCTSPCLQCSGTVVTCVSCIENYFLDQTLNTCGTTCVSPYIPLNRLCQKCVSPCVTCLNNEPYKCTSCVAGYKLLGNNCYQTCPPTTYSFSGQCLACTSGCRECTTTSSNCTTCFPGTYLFGSSCIPNCPITPIFYYEYQSQCISCQLPCKYCLATPIQCSDCISLTDYWNPVTLECTPNCSNPYFETTISGKRQCKQCELPCKQCSSNYDKCSACYNGKFLYSEQCLSTCPIMFYQQDNACLSCPLLCQTCTKQKCLTCQLGSFLYKQLCYSSCPPQAAYPYLTYCRNCLKQSCILCNHNNQCVMCFDKYFLLNGMCLQTCPSNYEPDSLTNLACVKTSQSALLHYLTLKQKQKIFIFPGTIILVFLIISVIIFQGDTLLGLFSLVSIPQTITTIIFVYFYSTYADEDLSINVTIPWLLVIAIAVIGVVMSIFYTVRLMKIYFLDQTFSYWYQYGSNEKRTNVIILFSFINLKISKILVSGFIKLPFTSYQLKNVSLLKYLNWLLLLQTIITSGFFFIISIYIIIVQKAYLINNKIFYSAVDNMIVHMVSLILTAIYMHKNHKLPQAYKKYIIEGVSIISLPPLSQQNQYIGNQEQNQMHLYHSNSVEDVKESAQMKEVDFKSVYDPSDFQDPPKFQPQQLQHALKKGKFRTKQKPKKKGKGKYKLDQLQMIQQQISDQQQKMNVNKKKLRNNQKSSSLVNNYIYWKPPKQKQSRAQVIFKQNRKQIMQKIYQKQSQFDTITNNDIIFLEQSQDEDDKRKNSNDNFDDSEYRYDSKRELNPKHGRNSYNDLLNLNYAKRKHLE